MPQRLPGSIGLESRGGWSPPDHNNEKTDQTPPLPCPIQTGAPWTFRLKPKLTSALGAVKIATPQTTWGQPPSAVRRSIAPLSLVCAETGSSFARLDS